jgi:murein L,D-transpeptidase YcbB/YkuD
MGTGELHCVARADASDERPPVTALRYVSIDPRTAQVMEPRRERSRTGSQLMVTAVYLVGLLLASPATAFPQLCPADADPILKDWVRQRVEAPEAIGRLEIRDQRARAEEPLRAFYHRREYAPAWLRGGRPSPCASALASSLTEVDRQGLDGGFYHSAPIDSLMALAALRLTDVADLVDLELLLSDAFLTLGTHLAQGRVDPAGVGARWVARRQAPDMVSHLEGALLVGDVMSALEVLLPRHGEYSRLLDALGRLRDLEAEGGWGTVPDGPSLHLGDLDPRVPALRRRLVMGGDVAPSDRGPEAERFDEALEHAVRRFQRRHGLESDGTVGRETLAALNVPVAARIDQVALNLERWRWLPDDLGRRHIRVSIADFSLAMWDGQRVVADMKAVVGLTSRPTPMLSGALTHLVLAPYWNVPPRIAAMDKLPQIQADPGYLARMGMRVFDASSGEPLDPDGIEWASMTGTELNHRLRIRQDPGPLNALGSVKFVFPNQASVYLHDTPTRSLFDRTVRAFSSGCVRVSAALDLASLVLAGDPEWPLGRIRAVADAGREVTVWLREPVSVHLLYWTAFVDGAGEVQFRPDIYGLDGALHRALAGGPPTS